MYREKVKNTARTQKLIAVRNESEALLTSSPANIRL
jgi:hypothetical protein